MYGETHKSPNHRFIADRADSVSVTFGSGPPQRPLDAALACGSAARTVFCPRSLEITSDR